MSGPLEGVRIIELAGLGPAPFAGMMLADAGADIIRIDRSARATYPPNTEPHVDLMNRGRRSVAVDLKHPDGVGLVLRLVEQADGLMEGFRPGVAERLGMGPDVCLDRNPKLVYGRMTGWGQVGPMAMAAGHDIDYIALAGALEPMARAGERPFPPLNLVGDFGGGGMLLAFGMCAAIIHARQTGRGPGGRRGHGRRCRGPDDHDLHAHVGRHVEGGARAPTCWTPAPTSTRCTRRPTAATWRSGPSSPSSTPS